MSFNTALSGLKVASSELGVVSNNVANSSTTGFKSSRAEFADVYATSSFGSGGTAIGSGVSLSAVSQQFAQGTMEFTDNALDIAISGRGFFITRPSTNSTEGTPSYTRAGAFQVDSAGYVTNSNNQYLQTFPVNAIDGTVTSTSLSSTIALKLPSTAGEPKATSQVALGANLPSNAAGIDFAPAAPATYTFNPLQNSTYSSSTSINIYDSQGGTHTMTYYFAKDLTNANTWRVYPVMNTTDINGDAVSLPMQDTNNGNSRYMTLVFSNNGSLDKTATLTANGGAGQEIPKFSLVDSGATAAPLPLTYVAYDANGVDTTGATATPVPANGSTLGDAGQIGIDAYNNSPTQFSTPFNVTTLSQNGYTAGRLTGLDVSEEGVIRANYSNGQQSALGKIAMAAFPNEQGLSQIGNTAWNESISSGPPLVGEAGTGSFGSFRSGALEGSNVDLTAQLVKLITAQRNFQANAKSIETNSAVTQTIINLR